MRLSGSPAGYGLKRALASGAAALALAAPALAQSPGPPTPAAGPDGLPPGAIYLDADHGGRDASGAIIAAGDVERALLRVDGRTLRARSLTYDPASGLGSAEGEVELIDSDGAAVYASRVELEGGLQAGVAVDFATRLANGASLMAATAVRRSPTVNELSYALFSPCPLCAGEGKVAMPVISVSAEQVVQDEVRRAIVYRNAVFRVKDVPVFWLPVFAHPDPTVERASGFLTPSINYDRGGRGLSVETPYLFVVSPSEDWLISPQINSEIAPLLNLQWRRRFADGVVVARGGYTYERNFGDFDLDGDGRIERDVRFGPQDNRSYLLAYGAFDPDGPWRWGFTAERTSDKTLFDRYDIETPYQDNGLYYGDQRRLISQLYAERQTERSYLSVAAFALQSLRVRAFGADAFGNETPALNEFEDDGALPLVGPLVEGRWEPAGPVLGGRLRLQASAAALYRDVYVGAPVLRPETAALPAGASGVDSRRLAGRLDWRRVIITGGARIEPFVDLRADLYDLGDLPAPLAGAAERGAQLSRYRTTVGVDLSYPLIRRFASGADVILEPMAQLSISNDPELDPRIPVEDAQTLELDASGLFRIDRFAGHDLLEGGARLTVGLQATGDLGDGRSASLFIGRSLRDDRQTAFRVIAADPAAPAATQLHDPTGLADEASDWVVQAEFEPADAVRGWAHATVDDSGEIRRAEAVVDARWGARNLASVIYLVDRTNPFDPPARPTVAEARQNYEFVQASGQQFLRGPWGVAGAGIYDVQRDLFTRSEIGLLYDDGCVRFEIGYRKDNTRVRPSGPSEGAYVRLTLATFGATR
ncbi:LPS assembly protein LptD [Brevundimonas sp.]|uniref:LPS-assembly protein LptD n=1 Tax=Brevundimonas sp. TaxID=1871086 RepID=UPI0022BEAF0F|nr:LPS assembly protein LptD [Brevundimonas sp.]MCZ8193183.1 LPS assembly protein LptD [Brevundimonas sp.]